MKILLIKLGHSETLDPEVGKVTSLGDVLRTTPLLTALKERHPEAKITWLVDEAAVPLLSGNPLLDRVLVVDAFVPFQLMREQFDIVINLEKHPGVCALADMVDAWARYGFRFDAMTGSCQAYEKGQGFLQYIRDKSTPDPERRPWQQNLIEMLGLEWKEQPYVLGYYPNNELLFDVGLNHMVGSKWPTKRMPEEHWLAVAKALEASGLRVSWQQGLDNLHRYTEWISSCRVILSQDSLGLHLALALGKRIVGLFGPTDPSEVCLYGQGETIWSETCPQMPCGQPQCLLERHCMAEIPVHRVLEALQRQLKPGV